MITKFQAGTLHGRECGPLVWKRLIATDAILESLDSGLESLMNRRKKDDSSLMGFFGQEVLILLTPLIHDGV